MLVHDEEDSKAIAVYHFRYAVKQGITGWAQVNGLRGEREIERVNMRVDHDLWYIQNWSLLLDMKIVFRTVGVILNR